MSKSVSGNLIDMLKRLGLIDQQTALALTYEVEARPGDCSQDIIRASGLVDEDKIAQAVEAQRAQGSPDLLVNSMRHARARMQSALRASLELRSVSATIARKK